MITSHIKCKIIIMHGKAKDSLLFIVSDTTA